MQRQCNWQYAVNLCKKANTNSLLNHAALQRMQYVNSHIAAYDKTSNNNKKTKKTIKKIENPESPAFWGPKNQSRKTGYSAVFGRVGRYAHPKQ